MPISILSKSILEIFSGGAYTQGSAFFKHFEKEAIRNEFGLTEDQLKNRDLVRFLCGIALMSYVEAGHSISDFDLSKDQRYRLRKFVQQGDVFEEVKKNVWSEEELTIEIIEVAGEPVIHVFDSGLAMHVGKESKEAEEEEFTFKEEGDIAFLEGYIDSTIESVDDLLERCHVDEGIWETNKAIVNTTASGKIQVKAYLSRIEPTKPKIPTIQPVQINFTPVEAVGHPYAYKSALIVPDPQIGFKRDLRTGSLEALHDRAAMDVVLQIAQDQHIDTLVILGDWLDLASWSLKFLRSPEFAQTTNPALAEGAWWLAQFRANANEAHFLEGNHEKRVGDSIIKHLEEAHGLTKRGAINENPLMSITNLLGLHEMDYKTYSAYPRSEMWLNDGIRVLHGEKVRSVSGGTSAAVIKDAIQTEIFGHIHRMELAGKTRHFRSGPQSIYAFSPGCLCRIDPAVPSASARNNWQQGCGIVHYSETTTDHSITPIMINEGRALYGGKEFLARNQEQHLTEDTGWNLFSSAPYAPHYYS